MDCFEYKGVKYTRDEIIKNLRGVDLEVQDGIEGLANAINEGSVKFSAAEKDADMTKATTESDKITLQYNDKGQHLAPNGKPSNLTESQAKIVRTPSFKNWFGDWENDPDNSSQVVDDNLEPLVVYHGSKNYGFNEFKQKEGSVSKSKMQLLFGNHFASSVDDAKIYTKNSGDVYSVFLNMRNPINLPNGFVVSIDKNFDAYLKLSKELGLDKKFKNNLDYDTFTERGDFGGKSKDVQRVFITQSMLDSLPPKKVYDALIKYGFDGVFYEPYNPVGVNQAIAYSESFISFNPNQVKLADGTNQTFSPNTNDIRFSADQTLPQVADTIVNNAIEHLTEVIKKGLVVLRAEKDPKKKEEIRKTLQENQKVLDHLTKMRKDPKFSVDAYHGSPFAFDRFTTDKIGTGEGAQAFGWGLYFTEIKSIADYYAKSLTNKVTKATKDAKLNSLISKYKDIVSVNEGVSYTIKGNKKEIKVLKEELINYTPNKPLLKRRLKEEIESVKGTITVFENALTNPFLEKEYADNLKVTINNYKETLADLDNSLNKDFEKLVEQDTKDQKRLIQEQINELEETNSELSYILDNEKLIEKNRPNLYKVSLHKGKTPDQYTWLEWDKELSQKQIQDLLDNDIDGSVAEALTNYYTENNDISTTKELVDTMYNSNITGRELYRILQENVGENPSDKAASIALLNAGIDGVKYPAESISRGLTSDNARGFNYVVFDENAVTIEERIQFQQEAAKFRAAAIALGNGQSIVAALEAPIPTSFMHEILHSNFVDAMSTEEKQAFIDEYNEVFGDDAKEWNTDTEEFFARSYEVYLSNGRQLSAAEVKNDKRRNILQTAFDTFTNLMKELYNGVITYNNTKGVTKPIVLSQQAQEFFDRINGIETIQKVEDQITTAQQEVQDLVQELETATSERAIEIQKRIKDILAETTGGITQEETESIAKEEGITPEEVNPYIVKGFFESVKDIGLALIKGAKTTLQKVINRMKTIMLVGSIAAGSYYYNTADTKPPVVQQEVAEQITYFTPEEIQGNIAYIAENLIGMEETGYNAGFTDAVFQGAMEDAGWQKGYPWCMTFAEVAAKHAGGIPKSLMLDLQRTLTPSVVESFRNLDNSRLFKKSSTPEVGAIVFYQRKDKPGFGHAGIVTRVNNDGTFDTIEGNTNSWGDADGDVVQGLQRSDSEVGFDLLGFAVLNKENVDKAIEEEGGTPKEPTENGLFPFLPIFGRRKKTTEEITEELGGEEQTPEQKLEALKDSIKADAAKLQEILKAKQAANISVDNKLNKNEKRKENLQQPQNDERGQTKSGETKDVKQRFLERILATKSYPQEIKDAILSKAPTKVVVPDSVSTAVAEEYVRGLNTLKDMQEGFEDLMKSWTDKVLAVTSFSEEVDLYSAVPQGAWEAMAVRMLHSKVTSVASPQQAAEFNIKVANFYSELGRGLRTAGLVDPRMTAIDALGQFKDVESKILEEETFKGSGKTHAETIENVKEIYKNVVNESKADVKAEIKRKLSSIPPSTKTGPTSSTKTGETTLNKLSKKADFYLNRFNERVKNTFGSGFDIDALTDYALFVYYKTAGSIVKARNAFEKKFSKDVSGWEKSWETIVNSSAFADATYDIAKEKLLAMLSTNESERSTSPDTTKNAASMVIESIVRHQRKRQGKEKKIVPPKTIEDIINARDLDIATLSDLRRDIEAGLLNVDAEKRVEVLANVEDLLLSLAKDKLDTIAGPWIKKSLIRQQLRGGGKNLNQVVDDMIDQVLDKDEITAPIAEEFIARTGMTAEEAAPYIRQIENTIDEIINKRVKDKLEKELVNSYGSLDSLAEEIAKLERVVNTNKSLLYASERAWREAAKGDSVSLVRAAKKEYDDNKKLLQENTTRLKALQQKKESIRKELTRKTTPAEPRKKGITKPSFTKVPTLENITNIVMKGGLSDETIREAFSQGLGTRNLTNADVDRIHTLITALENAVFAADRKPIAEELTRYVMGLKTKRDAQFFGDVFTSYVYGNMLGSLRTADLALTSALAQFGVTAIAEAGYQISLDVKNFFKGNPDFTNIRAMAESFKFATQSNTFSTKGLGAIIKGKEGLSLVDVDPQNKGSRAYARLENNLTTLDQMRAMRDIYRKDGDHKKAATLSILIGINMLNRSLMVVDYVTTSVAIPYYLHRNMTNETLKELAEDGFIDTKFTKIQNIINEKLGKDQLEQQLELEVLRRGSKKYNYRKSQLLFEFLDNGNKEQLIRAEDEVRMLTWVGRIAGFSGKAYDFINSNLTPAKDSKITLEKVLGLAAVKLLIMPFPSAAIRAVQMVKNTTPLGILQMKKNTIENISDPSKWDKIPFQVTKELNFYGDKESYQMRPGQRAARIITALGSTVLMGAVLNAAFTLSGGGEDDEYKVELDKDFPYLFTGKYNSTLKQKFDLTDYEYEPYTIYSVDKNGMITGRVGVYKDYPFLWSLAIVGKLQERLALDVVERKEGAFTTEVGANDPLTTSQAYSLALTGLLGFTTQNSFSSSAGVITAVTKGLEGESFAEGAAKQMMAGIYRQVTPLSALQGEIDNYASIALDLEKKKGLGSFSKVMGNMVSTRALIDNYDYDVLGRPVVKKPFGPALTSGLTTMLDWLSDNDKEYEREAKLLSKFPDVNEIKMLNFNRKGKDATETTTVAKPADEQLLYDLTLKAQKEKAKKLKDDYDKLKNLDKLKLTKELETINTETNTKIITEYVRKVLLKKSRIPAASIRGLDTMEEVNELFIAKNIYIDEEGEVKTIDHMKQALR